MFIFLDKENNIKAINSSTDETLTKIEIDRESVFPNFSDFMILNYKYIPKENGFSLIPTSDYNKLVELDYKHKVDNLVETQAIQDEDIQITQAAVDFILMSNDNTVTLNNILLKSLNTNMANYFVSRIIKGALNYEDVVIKYPEFKEDIDSILKEKNREDLIVEIN